MFAQVSQIGQTGINITLRTFAKPTTRKVERYMTSSVIQGLRHDSILFTTSTTTSHSENVSSERDSSRNQVKSLDNSVKMNLLKKNLQYGPGLKLNKNREHLVNDFFNLTKSVIDNQLSVDDFVNTETFKLLQNRVEYNVDIMSNSQIINLLCSVIKMNINPSTNLVKLLEHEVKFRLKMFNLNQIIKIFKTYDSTEMSAEQKQLAEMLNYRIRSIIQNNETLGMSDLNLVLQQIAGKQISNSLLGAVEERLLNILTSFDDSIDDTVTKYLRGVKPYDYESLCNLFIGLADNKRRPTPILKCASKELCKLNGSQAEPTIIISTLNALNVLSYPNRTLITKLVNDLIKVLDLSCLDSNTICSMLRSIGSLRWKSEELFELLFKHIEMNRNDLQQVDHNVVVDLVHVTALLNYKYPDMKKFYDSCIKGSREAMLDKQSRKWLNYVWSLVALDIADKEHITSVDSVILGTNETSSSKLTYTDTLKLLNLRAISCYEMKLQQSIESNLAVPKIQRGAAMQKFAEKIRSALMSLVNEPENHFRLDVETPFGFNIDYECRLDDKNELVPVKGDSFEELIKTPSQAVNSTSPKRCAIILASFDETIASSEGDEVVGHKLIIRRILKSVGYETIFLTEWQLNRISDSGELTETIKAIIKKVP